MKKFPPLPIIDLLYQGKHHPVPCESRKLSLGHMARTISRHEHNNMVVVGRRGVGKSTLIQGFAQASVNGTMQHLPPIAYIQLITSAVLDSIRNAPSLEAGLDHIKSAFASLPPCVFVIDDADALLEVVPDAAAFDYLFASFITSPKHRLVLVLEEELFPRVEERYNRSFKTFDTLMVKELSSAACQRIVRERAESIGRSHKVRIQAEALPSISKSSDKVFTSRSQPDRSLRFLDEVCAAAALSTEKIVTSDLVAKVMTQRLGLPDRSLSQKRKASIATLGARISGQVIGQTAATTMITSMLERSLVGLKNPNRPLGSFLFLGPSGVGKTELAKVIAQEVYGDPKCLVRIDMSEFSDAHTVARLIGAPPGYVGYEAGGQLTAPVMKQPYCLVLIDEMEKAHPSIFDIFLQVFDDGRLTDGQGRTVDFTNTIIIATSNIGIKDIVAAAIAGQDVSSEAFKKQTMLPLLQQKFRLEFLNRFEGLAVFRPLSPDDLLVVARLEITKMEERLKHHHIAVSVSDDDLRHLITTVYDPHLGARPLRRALERHIEQAVANTVLTTPV